MHFNISYLTLRDHNRYVSCDLLWRDPWRYTRCIKFNDAIAINNRSFIYHFVTQLGCVSCKIGNTSFKHVNEWFRITFRYDKYTTGTVILGIFTTASRPQWNLQMHRCVTTKHMLILTCSRTVQDFRKMKHKIELWFRFLDSSLFSDIKRSNCTFKLLAC